MTEPNSLWTLTRLHLNNLLEIFNNKQIGSFLTYTLEYIFSILGVLNMNATIFHGSMLINCMLKQI